MYDYEEKADLSKGYWKLKRKIWVTTHFSEIVIQVTIILKKAIKYKECNWQFFQIYSYELN